VNTSVGGYRVAGSKGGEDPQEEKILKGDEHKVEGERHTEKLPYLTRGLPGGPLLMKEENPLSEKRKAARFSLQ